MIEKFLATKFKFNFYCAVLSLLVSVYVVVLALSPWLFLWNFSMFFLNLLFWFAGNYSIRDDDKKNAAPRSPNNNYSTWTAPEGARNIVVQSWGGGGGSSASTHSTGGTMDISIKSAAHNAAVCKGTHCSCKEVKKVYWYYKSPKTGYYYREGQNNPYAMDETDLMSMRNAGLIIKIRQPKIDWEVAKEYLSPAFPNDEPRFL